MREPSFRSTIAALAAGQLLCWAALFYAFSGLVLPMQRALGWSRPALMGAFTLGLFVWGAATYAVGAAIDRGHGRAVLTAGSVLAGVGLGLWAAVQSLPMLYAAWALIGVAMAMTLYEPAFNILAKHHPKRFRAGISALTLVGGFASTLSFPAVAWLVAAFEWRGALAAMSLLLLAVVAPLHAWALRGRQEAAATPEHADPADDATLREALRRPAFWFLTLAFALHAFVLAGVFAHLMPALAEKGLDDRQALAVAIWFGPAQVFARLAYTGFARHRTPRGFALAIVAGTPAALAVFAVSGRTAGLIAFSVIFGLANGLTTIVRGSLVPDYFGSRHVGRISGAMSAIALVARAAAPFAIASLLMPLRSYQAVCWLLCALGVGAVLAYAAAGRPRALPGEARRRPEARSARVVRTGSPAE